MSEFDRVGALAMRHLLAFETVAEERSFTRAARRLGYTQSAVSHQMATLERLVGKQLIERPKGSEAANLTEAGEILHRHARALISRVKLAYDDLDGLAEGVEGTFRFGTYQSASTSILPHVLRGSRACSRACRCTSRSRSTTSRWCATSRRGRLDASFVTLPLPEGPLTRDRAAARPLRAARRARLAVRRRRGGAEPRGDRAAAADRLEVVDGVEDSVRERGYELNVIMRSDDSDTVRSLVAAGVGAAIVPRLIVDPGAASCRSRSTTSSASASSRSPGTPSGGGRRCSTRSPSSCGSVCASDLPSVSPRPGLRRG